MWVKVSGAILEVARAKIRALLEKSPLYARTASERQHSWREYSIRMMQRTQRTARRDALALLIWVATGTAMAGDWPAFRGPDGNGIAQEDKAPLRWGPGQNVHWKASLPGPGNSSPIVSRGQVFLTCAENSGKKRNLYCFDRRTGKELWVQTV